MEDRVVPQLDDHGNRIGIFGVARDITERKRAEEQLRFQADVLRNVHNSVIVTDLAG
jgi:PAS domain-containing protein